MGGGGKGESKGEGGGEDGCNGDVAGKKLLVQRMIVETGGATYLETALASSPLTQHHRIAWDGLVPSPMSEISLRQFAGEA